MSITSRYFEEFKVGVRYPTTSRLITLDDHYAFCKLVGYKVPLFVDAASAEGGAFGGIICPSHLIMSFSTAMTGALFSESILGLIALENARFLAPVRPGDTLRTEVEVVEKRLSSNPARGIVTFRDRVYNQADTLVFLNDKIALISCRAPGSPPPRHEP